MKHENQKISPSGSAESKSEQKFLNEVWNTTRPDFAKYQWNEVWGAVLHASAQPVVKGRGQGLGTSQIFKMSAIAAGLFVMTWIGSNRLWQSSVGTANAQNPSIVVSNEGSRDFHETATPIVSIDLQEADDLMIIRLDDERCPADAPCLETVEAHTAEYGGQGLASNFQLFNELESLAMDLR